MAKYSDVRTRGPSRKCPFRPEESASERHARRLASAHGAAGQLKAACEQSGLRLEIKNEGQHWAIRKDGKVVAQWWPSSAKLVFGQKYQKGVHCHDEGQVVAELKGRGLLRSAQA